MSRITVTEKNFSVTFKPIAMQKIEFNVPAWVIPVIANDGKTGINEHEEIALSAFFDDVQKNHGPGYWVAGEEIATFAYNDVDAYLGETWSAFYLLNEK